MTTFTAAGPGAHGVQETRSAAGARRGSVLGSGTGSVLRSVPRPGLAPLPRSSRELLADAGRVLGRAMGESDPREKFALAHLAALRGAAAVLAARAKPRRMAHGSAWELLAKMAPELAEWSAFFASGARRRQAIVAGVQVDMSPREADDLVRASAEFLDLVDTTLMAQSDRAAS